MKAPVGDASRSVCGVSYAGYGEWIERVDWWNFQCRSERAE
ncbi:hypothetical protein [Burkholderia sp. D-99]|nr:hypothetical protein [Burkholderia sp. D-99]